VRDLAASGVRADGEDVQLARSVAKMRSSRGRQRSAGFDVGNARLEQEMPSKSGRRRRGAAVTVRGRSWLRHADDNAGD
jgi:hypothetical protein